MVLEETLFNAPIPGESLVAELGGRPWQTPPKMTTVDEAVDYYMERMSSEEFMEQVIGVMESGVPVAVIANTIQLASVMDGVHSVDIGMLVVPIIMEMMMLLGDSAGIEYNLGDEESFIGWLGDYAGEYLEGKYGNPIKGVVYDFAYHGETFAIHEENTGDELWFPTDKHKLVIDGDLNLFYEAVN